MASTTTHGSPRSVAGTHCLSVFSTPLGWFAATWTGRRLQALTFGYESPRAAVGGLDVEPDRETPATVEMETFAERMQAYCEGHRDDFADVPIVLSAKTDFQRRVLEQCRRIPYGQMWTYAKLAVAAGSPRACRAVGNIMARNRIPLVIPCHRVVGAHGSLGGYSARTGLDMKRRLLCLEGAERSVK